MLDLILQQAGESEPGFARKSVKWAITCTSDGRYTGVVALGEGKGRTFERCPNLSQPELVGGDKPRAHYLAESLSTVALYFDDKEKDDKRKRAAQKHAWFVSLLRESAAKAPYLNAAAQLLSSADALARIQADLRQARAKPADLAVVVADHINPLERADWHDWWRDKRKALRAPKTGRSSKKMRCIVTGEYVEPAATHPKVKGLAGVGGQPTGDVLAGFDKVAFQSYGLEQSANAAMSEATATAYAETLNRLIAEKSVKLGNALSVYWFIGQDMPPAQDDVMSWFTQPPEQTAGAAERRAHELLTAIKNGRRPDLAGSRFVSLLLSGASGRVMVREVMQGSFEELVANTQAWFHDLVIVARNGQGLASDPKFEAVVESLAHDPNDKAKPIRNRGDRQKPDRQKQPRKLPSPWLQQLWRAAITGGPIPTTALAQAVLRARLAVLADKPASHACMGLIKAYLIRNQGDRQMLPCLNPDHPHPAYHCGRALALFARLQRAALGDVGAGVVQRYYTAASQTPGLILGRLASHAKNHLSKLDAPLASWYEDQIADIMSRIKDGIPRTLSLEEQSLFALGYYQQIAQLRAGKKGMPEGVADDVTATDQSE